MSEKIQTPQNQGAVAGKQGPAGQTGEYGSAEFQGAHAQSRSGNPYTPTTPGKLGNGVEGGEDGQAYNPGEQHSPGCGVSDRTLAWPDAPGGGLGRS